MAAHFLPLAFESEGFVHKDVRSLLHTWSQLWAEKGGYTPADAGMRLSIWMNELAITHARYLAQCIITRAKESREAATVSQRAEVRPPLLSDTI